MCRGMMAPTATVLYLAIWVSVVGGYFPHFPHDAPAPTPFPSTTEEPPALTPTFLGRHNATVYVHAGDLAALDCHVLRVGNKTVLWAKRNGGEYHILTVGVHTYHHDTRYSLSFEYPNNWKLQIRIVDKTDEGLYECQVSTHPPKIKRVFLSVTVPKIEIRDPRGVVVRDAYYRVDSTVGLQCVVSPAAPTRPVMWTKDGARLTTLPQHGLRVDTSVTGGGLTSWLHIARASLRDSGNYTCYTAETVVTSARVHVLDGESSAAMQHSTSSGGRHATTTTTPLLVPFMLLLAAMLVT